MPARTVGKIVAGRRRCSPNAAGPTWTIGVALAGTVVLAVAVNVGVQFSVILKVQIELEDQAEKVHPSIN